VRAAAAREENMARNDPGAERSRADELHPLVYKILVGLALWTLMAAWSFFADRGYSGLVLAVVTFFAVVVMATPYGLWRLRRRENLAQNAPDGTPVASFRNWLLSELRIRRGQLKASDAAVAILLPAAAAATGMTAFAIVFHLTAVGFH